MPGASVLVDPDELTAEQLRHILAAREARERAPHNDQGETWAQECDRIRSQVDPATMEAFDRLRDDAWPLTALYRTTRHLVALAIWPAVETGRTMLELYLERDGRDVDGAKDAIARGIADGRADVG